MVSLPSFSTDPTIDVRKTKSGRLTFLAMLFIGIAGLACLFFIESGVLSREGWIWLPLGSVFAMMFVHPIVELPNVFEAISILIMYVTFIGYAIVQHPDTLGNIFIITVVLLLIVILFEYPGRFSLE